MKRIKEQDFVILSTCSINTWNIANATIPIFNNNINDKHLFPISDILCSQSILLSFSYSATRPFQC